ncbi:AEC family transporter [Pseudorhodoferax soli]|uniref:Transporter n=1 Tax=Pseudorhodoferax soli TaxID=545864 RepID=A0A368XQ74_9BURK|nr:AEC family transporter [Pseudorhodoferax soli]RCW68667.1 hypothetical protein DES41_107188 [Pseudorhodoferax soli]
MAITLNILLPLFCLIAVGYVGRRRALFDAGAASVLNRFVVHFALPAALFEVVLRSNWTALWQPGFIATFGIATLAVFFAVLFVRTRTGKPVADATVDAVAASYSNTAYVGLPLCLLAFGEQGVIAATLSTLIVVCLLFTVAVVLVEVGLAGRRASAHSMLAALGRSVKNPIILAPLVAALLSVLGAEIPQGVASFLQLIGQAATPCALVGLGAFLADRPVARGGARTLPLVLTATKLVGLPLLTWWLARSVFHLPPSLVKAAVLMAALPTGTGPLMLAEFYRREAGPTATTTLLTTACSLVTLSALLLVLPA